MNLHDIQSAVHVGKDKRNDFGGYNYRTAEGILAALKAALPEGAHVIVSDEIQEVAGQIFVTATAILHLPDGGEISATGHAMHPLTKKGMDPSQITGAASSYARKYALSGLLALDDGSVDPDASKDPYEAEPQPEEKPQKTNAEKRDWVLGHISGFTAIDDLNNWLDDPKISGGIKSLPEPMQNEITTAANAKRNALDPIMYGDQAVGAY